VTALGPRRTLLALGLPGDRRDSDLQASVAATAPFADEYLLYDLKDLRGRAAGELPALMAGWLPAGVPFTIVPDQRAAMLNGWERVGPGDRLVIIVDEADEALEIAASITEDIAGDTACVTPIAGERAAARGTALAPS
jgi:cyanophycin synthetase